MKRIFCLCIAFFALVRLADAHDYAPWPYYLAGADQVCLAQVTSVEGKKVTFAVAEVLRGKPAKKLVLVPYPDGETYPLKSEWLLVSCPTGFKGGVGYAIKGDCEWIPGAVTRAGGKVFVPCSFPLAVPLPDGTGTDVLPDGTKGLDLDHIKRILKQSQKNH